jgi:hypothetical protein
VTCIIAQPRAVQGRRGIRARQFLEHASDLAIQGVERRPHYGDALAGQILEIARLENVRHAVPDVLCQAGFEIAVQQAREIVRRLIDVLGGGQDFLRRELASWTTASSRRRYGPSAPKARRSSLVLVAAGEWRQAEAAALTQVAETRPVARECR